MRLHISQPIIPDRRERRNRETLHLSACISTGNVCPHCQLTMRRHSAVVGETALRERRHLLSVCRAVAIGLRPEFLPMIMTVAWCALSYGYSQRLSGGRVLVARLRSCRVYATGVHLANRCAPS